MDARDELLLHDLLDDRLSEAASTSLRARLAVEPDLEEAWEDLLRIRRLLGQAHDRAPHDFLRRVRAHIAALPPEACAGDDDVAGAQDEATRPHDVPEHAVPSRSMRDPGPPAHVRWAWTRWASAAAALLLAGLGLRLVFLERVTPAAAPVEGLAVEQARRAPEPLTRNDAKVGEAFDAIAVDEQEEDGARPKEIGASAPARPGRGTPRPAGGAAPSRFRPGDQIAPGIRRPSDEGAPDVPAAVAGAVAKDARSARSELEFAGRQRKAPDLLLAMEADTFDEARAELALLVADVGPSPSPPSAARPITVYGLDDGAGQGVLGSLWLDLTRAQVDRLTKQAASPARDAPGHVRVRVVVLARR